MDSLDGYVSDDELAVRPLDVLGWQVVTLSWRQLQVPWDEFEAVVIRTTWDYQNDPEAFLSVLAEIDASRATLANPLPVVRWNLDKRYLREVERRGLAVVPTIWDASYTAAEFRSWQEHFACGELIIKPTVSATAQDTYRLRDFDPALADIFPAKPFLVQPFMPNIVAEGEYSLFYFAGDYSHAIVKSPKTGDFRVQEEHGGNIRSVTASDELLAAGQRAIELISPPLLYARVDFVRTAEDNFALMELELTEPALYFRMDAAAAERFAAAFDRVMTLRESK